MGAVLFLRLFVVKAGITVASITRFAVKMGVVANKLAVANIHAALFLMVFVVKTGLTVTVAPMEPNAI